tara:strand:+ start:455 stop:751 length:297 start_codon:yes stop_codon:yes gene_type:complete
MGEIIAILVVQGLFFGYLALHVAYKKNIKYGFGWGFFLGIAGLIVVAGLPMEAEKELTENNKNTKNDSVINQEETIDKPTMIIILVIIVLTIIATIVG